MMSVFNNRDSPKGCIIKPTLTYVLQKVCFKTNGQITYKNGGLNIGFKIMNTKSIYIYKNTLTITLYSRRFKTYNLFPAGAFISVDNFEPTGSFGK